MSYPEAVVTVVCSSLPLSLPPPGGQCLGHGLHLNPRGTTGIQGQRSALNTADYKSEGHNLKACLTSTAPWTVLLIESWRERLRWVCFKRQLQTHAEVNQCEYGQLCLRALGYLQGYSRWMKAENVDTKAWHRVKDIQGMRELCFAASLSEFRDRVKQLHYTTVRWDRMGQGVAFNRGWRPHLDKGLGT